MWTVTLGSIVLASPAAANGVVYVSTTDGIVHALNEATGTDVSPQFATGASIQFSSPAVANGIVYVGNALGNVFALG